MKNRIEFMKDNKNIKFMTDNKKWIFINLYILILCFVKFIIHKGFSYYDPFSNGINIIPFKTIYEYLRFFKHYPTRTWIIGFLSMFILVPLVLWMNTKKNNNFINSISNKNFTLFKDIFLISLNYSIITRILNVGVFDIDTCLIRSIITFVVLKLWRLINYENF